MTSRRTSDESAQATPAGAAAFYRPNGYAPEESAAYMMRRIITLTAQQVERALDPAGLTNAQWVPLFKLYAGKCSTVAELARETHLDAGAMTRLLDRLEAKDLCRRVRSTSDRRVVNIELTDAGREAASAIAPVLCETQNAHLEGFSTEEWQTLKGLLRRVLANAERLAGAQSAAVPTSSDGEKNEP